MALSDPESPLDWWALVDGLRPGDHIVFWRDLSRTCEAVLQGVLRGALARNDLAVVVLPEAEWRRLSARLRDDRFAVERFQEDGHLIVLSPTVFDADGIPASDRVSLVLEDLVSSARRKGYAGLTLLGTIAQPAFVRGDQGAAEAIESVLHDRRNTARIVCLYDSLDLYPLRIRDAYALIRHHSHTLTAFAPGRIVAETVGLAAKRTIRSGPRVPVPAADA